MVFTLNYFHWKACKTKQNERRQRISSLPAYYHTPLSANDTAILDLPVSTLVASIQSGDTDPLDVLRAYGKKALNAHAATNCLTEIMIASAETWAKECNKKGPLAGMPVSLKDTVGIAGWDSSIGYSAWVGKPYTHDAAIIRLLRDAGAVPFVKTSIPTTLLSFESSSSLFGRTTNPHNPAFSPGGSTGGEAALLAYGGSRIGIGTDVAGSVRAPAHYSGVYAVRASVGRFVRMGNSTSIIGQEGVPAVYSPMARTLEDLETFWKAVVSMEPWKYDHTCLVMPWKPVDLSKKPTKWGVMWDDGVVAPSPACKRALEMVVDTLRRHGHQVVTVTPPSPAQGLQIAAHLLVADGGSTFTSHLRPFEPSDPGMTQARLMLLLPRPLKYLYTLYLRYVKRDPLYADLVAGWRRRSVAEFWELVGKREGYKALWAEWWNGQMKGGDEGGEGEGEGGMDFLLTVPNAMPAVRHGGMKDGFRACGYTFLFNLLDYTAGVLPITHVDATLDSIPPSPFKPRNAIEKAEHARYDPRGMHGLPVGVQIVGRRLEEEKVVEGMKLVEGLLKAEGRGYEILRT